MSRNFKIGLFVVVSILLTTFTFYFWQVFRSPNFEVSKEQPFVLYVPTGGTYEGVIDSLKKNNVLKDEMSFRFVAKMRKLPESVKAGRYVIKSNMGNLEVVHKIRSGNQDALNLTFNNIRLKSDLVERVGNKFEFGKEKFTDMLNDPTVTQKYGFDTTNIVSMFLPNTYSVFWNTSANKFLGRMHDEYKKFWTPARQEKAKVLGYTQQQVSVLASIVDAETNQVAEMPRIAGVYLNRLRKNMPLQADPTIVFAHRNFSIKRVTNQLAALNSPYNTYRNTGLPPGPINIPSVEAVDAVLNPENHNYLYFCAKVSEDDKFLGYHAFAETYAEHLLNARLYQEALNKLNIR